MQYTDPQIYLNINFNNTTEALPVNPEKLAITRGASNTDIDIIGLGPAVRKGHPGLISMKISSFFPHLNSPFNPFGKTPEHYIKFINDIWESENTNNRVATLTTIGINPKIEALPFVIENFEYEHRGGDFDIYYTLSIKEYVPYGAKIQKVATAGTKTSRIASGEVSTNNKVYTVVRGDTLSGITKKCTGGTGDWRVLYELNKNIIGNDPNYIKVGQVLTLPTDWNAPVRNTNLTKSSKKIEKQASSKNDSALMETAKKAAPKENALAHQNLVDYYNNPTSINQVKADITKPSTSDKNALVSKFSKDYNAIKEAQEKLAKDTADAKAAKELEVAEKTAKANEIFLANRSTQTQKAPEKPGNTKPTPSVTPPSR